METKIESQETVNAEEILKDNLSDYYWALIENQTTLPDHEMTLKKWIIQAMEEYALRLSQETKSKQKKCKEAIHEHRYRDGVCVDCGADPSYLK